MSASLHFFRGLQDGFSNSHVGAAAAEIAAEAGANFVVGGIRVVIEIGFGGHDEAGRAVAALLGVVIDEGLGDRMGMGGSGDAFERFDAFALRVDGEQWCSYTPLCRRR